MPDARRTEPVNTAPKASAILLLLQSATFWSCIMLSSKDSRAAYTFFDGGFNGPTRRLLSCESKLLTTRESLQEVKRKLQRDGPSRKLRNDLKLRDKILKEVGGFVFAEQIVLPSRLPRQ
jgi:hypothetical protein